MHLIIVYSYVNETSTGRHGQISAEQKCEPSKIKQKWLDGAAPGMQFSSILVFSHSVDFFLALLAADAYILFMDPSGTLFGSIVLPY